ncbi:MAG: UDP-N-acetylglucosamine diphosphorylase [Parachlamydiaceae bacterium]|nr:UDP-N-acetylglucosamine diphosphorylase [Parachlamydiaceae bacterium]
MTALEISTYFDLHDYEHSALFEQCTYPWEALANIEIYIQQFSKQNKSVSQKSYPGAILVNPEAIFIAEGTVVEPGVYIEGPCIIGKNCTLRHGAYIRKNVITGSGCVIGNSTELKNVILLHHAHLAHHAYGGDSIFGNHCNLGAGAKCANLKFDKTEIIVYHEGNRYKTGLRKFGAIIADKVQLGCNSVTNPGTMLGKNSFLYPCTNFGGIAPSESTIRSDVKVTISSQKAKR